MDYKEKIKKLIENGYTDDQIFTIVSDEFELSNIDSLGQEILDTRDEMFKVKKDTKTTFNAKKETATANVANSFEYKNASIMIYEMSIDEYIWKVWMDNLSITSFDEGIHSFKTIDEAIIDAKRFVDSEQATKQLTRAERLNIAQERIAKRTPSGALAEAWGKSTVKTLHDQDLIYCPACEKSFSYDDTMDINEIVEDNDVLITCPYCKFKIRVSNEEFSKKQKQKAEFDLDNEIDFLIQQGYNQGEIIKKLLSHPAVFNQIKNTGLDELDMLEMIKLKIEDAMTFY
jgi:hypothetical protein